MTSNSGEPTELTALKTPFKEEPESPSSFKRSESTRSTLIRRTLKVDNVEDLDPLYPLDKFSIKRAGESTWAISDKDGKQVFTCFESPMKPQDDLRPLPVLKFVSVSGSTFMIMHQGKVDWLVIAGAEAVQTAVVGKIGKKSIRLSRGIVETWSIVRSGQSKSSSCSLTACCQSSSSIRYFIAHETIGSHMPRGTLVISHDGVGSVTIPANLDSEDNALIVVGVVIAMNLPYELED